VLSGQGETEDRAGDRYLQCEHVPLDGGPALYLSA